MGVNGDVRRRTRADLEQSGGGELGETIAGGPVPHLVMILEEGDEPVAPGHGPAVDRFATSSPEGGEGAVVPEGTREHLGQDGQRTEVDVVGLALTGHESVEGVVDVVVPLRIEPEPALGARRDDGRVVQIRLGDEQQRAPQVFGKELDPFGQFAQNVVRGVVAQRMDGVEAQRVEVELAEPHLCVLEDVLTYGAGRRPVQVDQVPPRAVSGLEIGPELGKVVAARAEVVVDHVQRGGQPARMAGVDESLETVRAAIGLVHGVPQDTVVAPVPLPVEVVDREQLDMADTELDERVQLLDGGGESAFRGERPDVQLVEHRVGKSLALPAIVHPVPVGFVETAGAVDAVGLPAGAGIGQQPLRVIEQEAVVPSGARPWGRRPRTTRSGAGRGAPSTQQSLPSDRAR